MVDDFGRLEIPPQLLFQDKATTENALMAIGVGMVWRVALDTAAASPADAAPPPGTERAGAISRMGTHGKTGREGVLATETTGGPPGNMKPHKLGKDGGFTNANLFADSMC